MWPIAFFSSCFVLKATLIYRSDRLAYIYAFRVTGAAELVNSFTLFLLRLGLVFCAENLA